MKKRQQASSAMQQLPEPMKQQCSHTYAHKDGFPYLPVSLSHSINPDTAAGTGADKQQVGSQQGCVSVRGGVGGRRVLGDFILPPSNAITGSSQ